MRSAGLPLLLAGALLPLAAGAQEPSLAEIAKREKERRKKIDGPARVITEADLPAARWYDLPAAAPPEEASETTSDTASAAAGAPAEEKTVEQLREERRAALQKLLDDEAAKIGRLRDGIAQAQQELNDLSTLTFGGRRQGLLEFVEKAEAEVAVAEQKIAQLEDDARREGVRLSR